MKIFPDGTKAINVDYNKYKKLKLIAAEKKLLVSQLVNQAIDLLLEQEKYKIRG